MAQVAGALLRSVLEDATMSLLWHPWLGPAAVPVAPRLSWHKQGHGLVHGAGEGEVGFSHIWKVTCLVTRTGQETAFVA